MLSFALDVSSVMFSLKYTNGNTVLYQIWYVSPLFIYVYLDTAVYVQLDSFILLYLYVEVWTLLKLRVYSLYPVGET